MPASCRVRDQQGPAELDEPGCRRRQITDRTRGRIVVPGSVCRLAAV
jgi:hypothetical protein